MFRRIIASCLFLVGGLLTWFAIEILHELAASQAGMSAGPVSGFLNREKLVMWLLCLYFLSSAFSAVLLNKKADLIGTAILAHLLLIVAFCILCSEDSDEDIGKFFAEALTMAVIMTTYFLPWMILWKSIVKKSDSAIPQNWPPEEKRDEDRIKIKQKY